MKRLSSILKVLLAALLLAGSTSAWADEFKKGHFTFHFTPGETTCSLIKCDSAVSGKIVIPKKVKHEGKTYWITSIGYAFGDCPSLTSITLPEGVTDLGYGYDECSAQTLVIPQRLTWLESLWPICYWENLKEIIVEKGNTSYTSEDGLLYNRAKTELLKVPAGKTSVTIPASVKKVGNYAFDGCSKLTEISVDAQNTAFSSEGGMLFNKDKTILIRVPHTATSVSIPKTVTRIEVCAFEGCSSLTTVTLPDGLKEIDYRAFEGCTSLKSITIPESVEKIAKNAFESCMEDFQVSPNNPFYTFEDGVLYNKNKTKLISVLTQKTSLHIPASVLSIEDAALGDSLTEIVVDPNNAVYASEGGILFNKDKTMLIHAPKNLKDIVVPASVTLIEDYAIKGWKKVTITFKGKTPPATSSYSFGYFTYISSRIIVPAGCEEAYKKASPKFADNLNGDSTAGTTSVAPPPTPARLVTPEIITIIE